MNPLVDMAQHSEMRTSPVLCFLQIKGERHSRPREAAEVRWHDELGRGGEEGGGRPSCGASGHQSEAAGAAGGLPPADPCGERSCNTGQGGWAGDAGEDSSELILVVYRRPSFPESVLDSQSYHKERERERAI
jgi:hypothetical protein